MTKMAAKLQILKGIIRIIADIISYLHLLQQELAEVE